MPALLGVAQRLAGVAQREAARDLRRDRAVVHGFVSLEIGGSFASMQLDPDRLFRAELERL